MKSGEPAGTCLHKPYGPSSSQATDGGEREYEEPQSVTPRSKQFTLKQPKSEPSSKLKRRSCRAIRHGATHECHSKLSTGTCKHQASEKSQPEHIPQEGGQANCNVYTLHR